MCNNTDGSQNNYDELEKPDTRVMYSMILFI